MIVDTLTPGPERFAAGTGWQIKPQGACRGDACVPLGGTGFDLQTTAERLGMALVHDPDAGLWAVGPETLGDRALLTEQAPELELDQFDGTPFRLSDLRGQKVAVVSWAPWQGCAYDLPGWQALRTELHPRGLEVVTVCLDDAEAARPHVERARPDHPTLIDPTHRTGSVFGMVNVPSVVWIDEQGSIVRPAEPGWPRAPREYPADFGDRPRLGIAPGQQRSDVDQAALLATGQDRTGYADVLVDWVEHGAASRYVLSPAEVVARSRPRPREVSQAAAHMELALHLWQAGRRDLAVPHFTAAHRLQPDNWNYRRQAWGLVGQDRVGGAFGRFVQGPVEGEEADWPFESDFASDVGRLNEGEFYPRTL